MTYELASAPMTCSPAVRRQRHHAMATYASTATTTPATVASRLRESTSWTSASATVVTIKAGEATKNATRLSTC